MLEHVLHAKKARTDLAADSGDEDSDTAHTDDWDLADFGARIRACVIGVPSRSARARVPEAAHGKLGYLHHARHGLVGSVS